MALSNAVSQAPPQTQPVAYHFLLAALVSHSSAHNTRNCVMEAVGSPHNQRRKYLPLLASLSHCQKAFRDIYCSMLIQKGACIGCKDQWANNLKGSKVDCAMGWIACWPARVQNVNQESSCSALIFWIIQLTVKQPCELTVLQPVLL